MVRLALFDVSDDQPGKVAVEIFLELRELGCLRCFRGLRAVGRCVLGCTSRRSGGTFQAGGSISSCGQLRLQCLDFVLSGRQLGGRFFSLILESSHFLIALFQLLLE